MKNAIILLAILGTASLVSCKDAENSNNKMVDEQNEKNFKGTDMQKDADFASEAATGSMMEVELGKLAMANASAPRVKEFGKAMIDDHTTANAELSSVAQSKNIALPAVPDNSKQKKIDELRQKTGTDFDKAYIDLMVSDHKDDIDLFQKEADKGNDADLKAWASAKVPVLQHHLQMAQEIQSELK